MTSDPTAASSSRRLSNASVDEIDPGVARPRYDRSRVTPGIVHIGVGGFHRAHMAVAVDRLLAAGGADEWGICGVGLLASDDRIRDALRDQDHLYTVDVRGPGTDDLAVIGSIVDLLYAPEEPDAVIERLAAASTRIVSMTITEGGYNIDQVTGEFDLTEPAVAADLTDRSPRTVFGFVTEALRRRRERGLPGVTVLSCDNIERNGDVAATAFLAFATAKDPDLAAWIRREVTFPSSMVDRITPATTAADVDRVTTRLGVRDAWPVVCEPFFQWVIEDEFAVGRPAFEAAGAQLVADVEPYELMKLRLLNASHQALCYFAFLLGYRLVHDAMGDPLIRRLLQGYMDEEATPTLAPVPGIDLDAYKATLMERFANPGVRDTVARLCADSSNRIPKWLVPVVTARLASGGSVRFSAAVIASWARYAEGVDEEGSPIDIVDARRDDLVARARGQRTDPRAFIENRALFGDLANDDRFMADYLAALADLHTLGARATLQRLSARPALTDSTEETQ